MANRYWVGGTANWDATAGTKWATTSGGAGGAAVPTSADDVFFDAASGAVTCTLTGGYFASCLSLTCTGFTGTLAGGASAFDCFGNFVLSSGMSYTSTTPVSLYGNVGTFSIDLQGKTIGGAFTILGSAVRQLQSAFTSSGALTISFGTFTTNNYAVTATSLSSSNTNVRTINLGSSTVTFSANSTPITFATSTNLTFNAGTSSIVCNGLGNNFDGGGQTFYNVSWTGTASGLKGVAGANTFNNLTVTGPASAGVIQFTFSARQTINGTLSTTGTAGNRRVWFQGLTYGLAQTLTINSAPSLTDADFRDIYVIGTAAPISGTRVGDLRGCSGITFDAAKTVYWNLAGAQNWSATGWATTSAGTPSDDNFPLAQDTATFTNAGSVTGTITMNSAIPYTGTVDMSGRTSAMTLTIGTNQTIYGNWSNGSGTTMGGASPILFSGRNTQTITSAGKAFGGAITIDTYGGTAQLADALNVGTNNLTVTNGTFDTKNYNVTAGSLSSANSNVRTITLGSSTVTLSGGNPISFVADNLTFNAGTSLISSSGASAILNGGAIGVTFYNVTFTGTTNPNINQGVNTFNNLTFTAPASAGICIVSLSSNQTITGTLTVAGATAVRRIFVRSDFLGTARTLTVGTLSATDCDFRDITMAGAAAGSSPTRAGDCGGNTGITFPAAKTVYWNLAGVQNWSATGWCPSSGGTPDINQFPLAQDTAVFDDAGAAGTASINAAWNTGTFNASARTSVMTLSIGTAWSVYGNFLFGSGVTTSTGPSVVTFSGRGTQTITSNGRTFGHAVTVDSSTGTVQLADALVIDSARTLTLTSGTFDAVTYNVTTGFFVTSSAATKPLKMGSGTWTLSGTTGTVWEGSASNTILYKGTANIVLSDTGTGARTFNTGALSYNKLTIGGATGTSTLTIAQNGQFTELASTKTVAHTIALGTTTQTFGAWTVTGTVGNVVTVTGTATITIAGARVSGVDYLALGTTTISATSPGEFYAGANSTGTGTGVILTVAPTATTRYWRGGTGTWDATTTTNWSTTSGGVSGASVPTSADAVIFDTLSNATAYTVTCTATQLRCAALTFAGPATGNVTWAGTAPLAIHGNTSLAATGITRSYTGNITLSGSSTGRTLTTNGVTLASATTVNGVGCGWTLGSALNIGSSTLTVTNGSFSLATYNFTAGTINTNSTHTITIDLGSSTVSLSSSAPIGFGSTEAQRANFTFTASTSQINFTSLTSVAINGNNNTFYNASATTTDFTTFTIRGINTFNNLTTAGRTSSGVSVVSLEANQTINGTLTLSAGTNATMRTFVQSNTIGTTRTLTCAAVASLTDIDFRDITIAGAAAPVSGTRLGDAKGNSGITFGAGVTRYWNLAAGGNWSATGWAATSGGAPAANNFPLAQDTCLFEATGLTSGNTVTVNAAYNIGTIDMSARTSNTMTLATGSTTPAIYGNWINGTGTTLTGTGALTFAGRGSQTLTSAGRTFAQSLTINSLGGTVTLQDALVVSRDDTLAFWLVAGTFNANNYNVTLSGTTFSRMSSDLTGSRTLALGSGLWTIAGFTTPWSATSSLTITGTGTISLTSASAKTFAGGGVSYSGITLNQGGAGTLTITGNNTFKNITNSYSATGATTIAMGTTTQTVTQFTGTGTVGKVLTIQGTSASSPATLILSSGTVTAPDYLAITGVRAYSLSSTWYAGANSTNNGSLGWIFSAGVSGIVLAGVLASGGVGTITTSQEFLQALTGVFATGGVGTISIQPPALTNVFASGGVGTITTSQTVSFAVTGVSATGSLGTITTSQVFTKALTGNLATGFTGTIDTSQALSRALTGNSASGAVGTVSYGRGYDISGVGASGAVGTVVSSQAFTRVLTGVSASGIVGTIIPVSWQLINDSQNADWQLVNNTQTTTWQLVDTST